MYTHSLSHPRNEYHLVQVVLLSVTCSLMGDNEDIAGTGMNRNIHCDQSVNMSQ